MIVSSQPGVPGITSPRGRGVSSQTRFRTATVLAARNGGRPLAIWYSTLPRLNRSARWSSVSPRACSGAMYIGVPAIMPAGVMRGVIHRAGQAEVRDLRPLVGTIGEQNIGRLDVAMDQVGRMGGRQTGGHLLTDPQDVRDLERPVFIHSLLQRLARDVLHHQIGNRFFFHGVNGDDVLVRHGGGRPGFSQEPLAWRRGRGQFGTHQLDRHHSVQLLIKRLGDDAERAASQDLLDLVMRQSTQPAGTGGRLQVLAELGLARGTLVTGILIGVGGVVRMVRSTAESVATAGVSRNWLVSSWVFSNSSTWARSAASPRTGLLDVGGALGRIGDLNGGQKNVSFVHDVVPRLSPLAQCFAHFGRLLWQVGWCWKVPSKDPWRSSPGSAPKNWKSFFGRPIRRNRPGRAGSPAAATPWRKPRAGRRFGEPVRGPGRRRAARVRQNTAA